MSAIAIEATPPLSQKVNRILSFLHEAESPPPSPSKPSAKITSSDSYTSGFESIRNKLVTLQIENEDKSKKLDAYKQQIEELRASHEKHVEEM